MNRILALGVVIPLVMPIFAYQVQVTFDRTARFSRYKTYSVVRSADIQSPKVFPIGFSGRTSAFIQEQLTGKHLKPISAGADLAVTYKITFRTYSENINVSDGVGPTGLGWGNAAYVATVHIVQGWTLVINIVDTKQKRLVFEGRLSEDNSPTPAKNGKKLAKAVSEILQNYPPEP